MLKLLLLQSVKLLTNTNSSLLIQESRTYCFIELLNIEHEADALLCGTTILPGDQGQEACIKKQLEDNQQVSLKPRRYSKFQTVQTVHTGTAYSLRAYT